MGEPSARRIAAWLAVLQVSLLTASIIGPAVGPFAIPIDRSSQAAGDTALQLNGTNDHVTFGPAPALGASTFTVEAWFKWAGGGATTSTGALTTVIPLVTKGRGEADGSNVNLNYFLGIQGGKLAADYEEALVRHPRSNHQLLAATTVTNNVWHHAAATFDGTDGRIYLDGVLDGTLNVGAGRLPRSDSIQHAGLGTAMTSAGTTAGFFHGVIDEARVWNDARSLAQINAPKISRSATTPRFSGCGT